MELNAADFLIIRSATGAYSCCNPTLTKRWSPAGSPNVAILLLTNHGVFRVFLSLPSQIGKGNCLLDIENIKRLPINPILEVKYDSVKMRYYLHDDKMWTKVACEQNPFLFEVYTR